MQYMDLNEKRQHGTSDFPFAFYHLDQNHPRFQMNYHWHPEYEIIRVQKGFLDMTLDERQQRINAGEMVFVHAGVLHSGIPDDSCIYECLVFDLTVFSRHNTACAPYFQKILDRQAIVNDFFPASSSEIQHIADSVFRAIHEKKPGYELEVFGGMYRFFSVIFRDCLYTEHEIQTRHGYRKVRQLRRVLDYIDANYSQDISLEQLAGAASMSPKYFCRFFRQMTHRTPMDYLNYQRIEHACYALTTGDASITEIAYACGFNDLSYFIKTFRKYKGMTPGQYRH